MSQPSTNNLAGRNDEAFQEIVQLIAGSRAQAMQAVNTTLIDLYWRVGETICRKIEGAEWGDGAVVELANYIARTQPGLRGFTRANLFRMRQFYQTYRGSKKSHHWCDNCRGLTISSFWAKANGPKSANSIFAWQFGSVGADASWNARSRRCSSGPC
jgi:hypothetical protein